MPILQIRWLKFKERFNHLPEFTWLTSGNQRFQPKYFWLQSQQHSFSGSHKPLHDFPSVPSELCRVKNEDGHSYLSCSSWRLPTLKNKGMLDFLRNCFSFQYWVARKNTEPERQIPERSLCSALKEPTQRGSLRSSYEMLHGWTALSLSSGCYYHPHGLHASGSWS